MTSLVLENDVRNALARIGNSIDTKEKRIELMAQLFERGLTAEEIKEGARVYASRKTAEEEAHQKRIDAENARLKEERKFENAFPAAFRSRKGEPQRLLDVLANEPLQKIVDYRDYLEQNVQRLGSLFRYEVTEALGILNNEITKRTVQKPQNKAKDYAR